MTKEQHDFITRVSNYLVSVFHFNNEVADFIGCQFALESAFGSCDLAKLYHNYCGMKVPLYRLSCADNFGDVNRTFAHYPSFESCIADYVLWLQYQKPLRKELDSLQLFPSIIRNYCPSKDYIKSIKSIYQQFKNYKNGQNT